jgi:hypothetical protein
MVGESFTFGSPVLSLGGLLLLWFYTVWQTYVIEAALARLAGLQEIWREALSLDPAWRDYSQARTVQELLDSSREKLPRLSLAVLLGGALLPSRDHAAACARIYDGLNRLPSKRLRDEAISIVETAARYVVLAALKRSLFAWALAPLLAAAFIVWSVHWQLRIVVEGVPRASLNHAGIRLRRKILGPLVTIVTSSFPA